MLAILVQISNFKFQISKPGTGITGLPLKLEIWHLIFVPLVVGYLASGLNAWTLHPDHGPDRPAPEMAYIELELLYQRAAADLRPYVTADTVIAAGDIGALGFDTGARILDTLGLISPQAQRYYPLDPRLHVNAYAMSPQVIFDYRPDWIVSPEVYIRNGLLKNARLLEQYQLFETIPSDIYGSRGMLVFRRK
jgi:hypothetical protein